MVLPIIVLPVVAGAACYGCARVFNWSQNAAASSLHGQQRTRSYPWPPNAFSERPTHSSSTAAGSLLGVVSFVAAFRFQRRYLFRSLEGALAHGTPTGAKAAETQSTSAFLGSTARGTAFISLNALTSSAIAGALTPLVDGDSRPAA